MTAGAPELIEARTSRVGEAEVARTLPQRGRRTVGAWCFVDHFGPVDPGTAALEIGPHPHIGLHTVTWLLDGELLHRDSLGSEQPLRPGQLNLMTAGNGIAHAEERPGRHGAADATHAFQLWVAQPDATRFGPPAFEHHGELPAIELASGLGSVLVGEVGGVRSPARADTPLVGADLVLAAGSSTLSLDPSFEHVVVVATGSATVDGAPIAVGCSAYLPIGREEVTIATRGPARLLLLGGEPFEADVLMFWNYVARTHAEVDEAVAAWNDATDRFAPVDSPLARIPSPLPIWRP